MDFKFINLRHVLWVLLIVGSCSGGFYAAKRFYKPSESLTQQETKVNKSTKTKTKITTTTQQPDGTTVTETKEEENSTKENSETSDKPSDITKRKSKYSVDVSYLPSIDTKPSIKDVEVEVGFRLNDSDAWVTSGYDVKHNQLKVGVRVEF
jgi:hypothetical protein